MSSKNLETALVNAPETKIKVSAGLHQNIMRAVRLAEPVSRKPALTRIGPAWAVGAMAVMVAAVIFYLPQQGSVDPVLRNSTVQSMSQVEVSTESLLNLEEGLLALSEEASTPETELRKELERLKSDLARFDFRS
jgi:hypothetical protein